MTSTTTEIIQNSHLRIDENTQRIKKCLNMISEEEVWQRPNPSSNSIGNLILHLCGNITQYIISSLGNTPDTRERDSEFSTTGGFTKAELLEKIQQTADSAKTVIANQSENNLLAYRSVQGFNFSGIGIIIHVLEHYAYHTGQIAFWTKLLRDKDLGFYDGIDLNIKNE